ncbi:uncharacterized protein LOC131479141, partial [Ochotona princeps]|uniref:uncharacterized protein LOC131479141 n=1 Tax=Ochotona princeps TaxID=9978 RepID=UPI002714FBF4
DLKSIFVNLLNRLAAFAQASPTNLPTEHDIYSLFQRYIGELQQRYIYYLEEQAAGVDGGGGGGRGSSPHANINGSSSSNMSGCSTNAIVDLTGLLELQQAFLSFSLSLYPDRIDYVDAILGSVSLLLSSCGCSSESFRTASRYRQDSSSYHKGAPPILTPAAVDALVEIISSPLRSLSLPVLELQHFPVVMGFLNDDLKRQVASSMVGAVLAAGAQLEQPSSVSRFLEFVSPLLRDSGNMNSVDNFEEGGASSEFIKEQEDIAKLVHLLYNADTDVHFTLLCLARQTFAEGGLRRLRYLGPPLVVAALELVPRILDRTEQLQQRHNNTTMPVVSGKKVYQFVHSTCMQLVQSDPQSALRLFLMAAESADTANLRTSASASSYEAIVYEFLTQALVCYEEEILDSKNQYMYLLQFVGCLSGHIHTLERESYETVCAKVAQHAAKLLKKPDQCRAILACSHLFWNNELFRDPRRVLECLQKCLKIADIAVQSSTTHVGLFTDILDEYIYYYERDNPEVTVDFIKNLLSLCAEHVKFALHEAGHEDEAVANFRNSVRYLKYKKETASDNKWRATKAPYATKRDTLAPAAVDAARTFFAKIAATAATDFAKTTFDGVSAFQRRRKNGSQLWQSSSAHSLAKPAESGARILQVLPNNGSHCCQSYFAFLRSEADTVITGRCHDTRSTSALAIRTLQ